MSVSQNPSPIIQTKFYAPRLSAGLINRERLLVLLDGSLEVPLTLVSAPAGYGKSVLISQWLDLQDHNKLWLSLDSEDSSIRQFLSYLIADLRNEFPDACQTSQELLHIPDEPSVEVISSYLLNDLDELEKPCSIVLDDYHMLAPSSPVHELLDMVMRHPPSGVHFVLITRRDPPLQLIQLRAINHLLEIRLGDLQFTQSEIRELLISGVGFTPSEDALSNLQSQMEGWAVGLRLVMLALRQNNNPDEFLRSIHGGIPQSQEYLFNQVLSTLSPGMHDTLLKVSLLDRFCEDLVGYVSDTDLNVPEEEVLSGKEFILQLEQRNLFTICIDQHHRWYRFHHLFQDLLQNEFKKSPQNYDFSEIHLRASQWYESNGSINEAIKHALKAGDTNFAVNIIERHFYDTLEQDQHYILEGWLEQIPAKIIIERPELLLAQMWIYGFRQDLANVAELLEIVDLLVPESGDEENLRGEVDFFHGYQFFWAGEIAESIKHLKLAQLRIARHKHMLIAEADLHLGTALYMAGQGDEALKMIDERVSAHGGIHLARRIGARAFIQLLSGDLSGLGYSARRMRTIDRVMRTTLTDAWSYYFYGVINLQHYRLDEAARYFSHVLERPHLIDERAAIDTFAGMALVQQMFGEPEKASQTIENLEHFVGETASPEIRSLIDSCKGRVGLLQGKDQFTAMGQLKSAVSTGFFDLFSWLEVPALTRVRVLAAEGSEAGLAKAQELLDEARQTSESCNLVMQLIEIAVIQALVLEKQGLKEAAEDAVEHAIGLAEPGCWIRPFVEAGPKMAELVVRFSQKRGSNRFVLHLLEMLNGVHAQTLERTVTDTGPADRAGFKPDNTFDGLTNRELDILELLAQRLQNKEIANRLYISTHTVKDHLKHIYQKLGVNNRRQAISQAIETGIIKSDHRRKAGAG